MKDIYLGLDLCQKNMQLSFYQEDKQEPESIYQLYNKETYQLPNVMFYALQEKKWYVGNGVSDVRFHAEGVMVEDVVEHVGHPELVQVGEDAYSYGDLLLLLIQTLLQEFLERIEESVLRGLTVTLERYTPAVYEVLEKLPQQLGLSSEAFYIMSHENAFFQYVMYQDEKLRTNSVAMFEYGTEGMEYYRIDKKHQGSTTLFLLAHQDMKEELPYASLFRDVEKVDEQFAGIAKAKMRETYISTVYLTGPGFNDNWMQEATKVLCDGRRVFMGQNIYTKGACYHARMGAYERNHEAVLYTQGSIPFDIGVSVGEQEGKHRFLTIASGGREWYNMKGKVTLFLDDTNRIELLYRDKVSKELQREIIEIHGLPKRPPKTTKLSLEVEMLDEKTGAVVIRDVGFGKIYPTTNKIYRKEFTVG